MTAKKLKTGTTTRQRIAIWAILTLTIVATVALYASSFLGQKNRLADQQKVVKQNEECQALRLEYQEKVNTQAAELSKKYYDIFKEYEKNPKAFNSGTVTELKINDLKIGNGKEFTDETETFSAYYIGWKPDGTVFDGSFNGESLKSPLTISKSGDQWGLIQGWTEGIQGMKIGGIREISIPSDKAYGETGTTGIDPNTPLKFIVYLIPTVEEIPYPDCADIYGA